MKSIETKVIERVWGIGRGYAFSQVDFVDLGSRDAIDKSLSRLSKKKQIEKVIRGIYYYPDKSNLTNEIMPVEIQQVAQALSRKFGWRIMLSGETALNILGLSNQILSKYVYMSDGRSKKYEIGNRELIFKKAMLKEASFKHHDSEIIVQALRSLGLDNVNDEAQDMIRQKMDLSKANLIIRDTKNVTGWIQDCIRRIYVK